jgi:hypothetical protein
MRSYTLNMLSNLPQHNTQAKNVESEIVKVNRELSYSFAEGKLQCCGCGSGIRCNFEPWIRGIRGIRGGKNSGSGMEIIQIRDKDPGSATLEN